MVNITDKVSDNEDSISSNIPSSFGSAGQVLAVNSGATAGEWVDAAGGQTTKISTTTVLSDATSIDITLPTSGYRHLRFHLEGVRCTNTNAHAEMKMLQGTVLKSMYWAKRNIDPSVFDEQSSGTQLRLSNANTLSNSAETQLFGFIDIHIPTERNTCFQWFMGFSEYSTNGTQGTFGVGTHVGNNGQMLIDKFRFEFSQGSVTKGTFTLYGIA